VYQGEVRTQDVVLETECETTVVADDLHKRCTDETIGRSLAVGLKADNIREFDPDVEEEYVLIPYDDVSGIERLRGRIVTTDETGQKHVTTVDVGCGRIRCYRHRDITGDWKAEQGEWIELRRILGLYVVEFDRCTGTT